MKELQRLVEDLQQQVRLLQQRVSALEKARLMETGTWPREKEIPIDKPLTNEPKWMVTR